MKIAFPVMDNNGLNAALAEHFGRAPLYTIVDTITNNIETLENTGEHYGGQHSAPMNLKNNKVEILICKGLGLKAIDRLNQLKIVVYLTKDFVVKEALESYKNNELSLATENDSCKEERHH
ncbi:MAG TPA: NifB/NifX family molybdenum-iron cluster-binding protein [Candidatus Bathyarchaeia archaeon]|nr:NifB/NifX family molybdenum-iron cluster-binding protein [Candidatus Bathyarchaeia archaeon]